MLIYNLVYGSANDDVPHFTLLIVQISFGVQKVPLVAADARYNFKFK